MYKLILKLASIPSAYQLSLLSQRDVVAALYKLELKKQKEKKQ